MKLKKLGQDGTKKTHSFKDSQKLLKGKHKKNVVSKSLSISESFKKFNNKLKAQGKTSEKPQETKTKIKIGYFFYLFLFCFFHIYN